MRVEKNSIYQSYQGSSNSLIIAPHATMSDEFHIDGDTHTGRMAIDVSKTTNCSYILGVPPRNKEYRGSHDFNNIPNTSHLCKLR